MVAVLSKAGDQLPSMPLVEVVGNAAKALPEHIGPTAVKSGKLFVAIVIFAVAKQPLLSV